jgi:hypothetical protein
VLAAAAAAVAVVLVTGRLQTDVMLAHRLPLCRVVRNPLLVCLLLLAAAKDCSA